MSSVLCIVLWKRYGASHLNCLLAIFDPNLIIQKKLKLLYHFGYLFQTGFLVEPIFPACSPDFIGTVFGFNLTIELRSKRFGLRKSAMTVSLHIFGTSGLLRTSASSRLGEARRSPAVESRSFHRKVSCGLLRRSFAEPSMQSFDFPRLYSGW